MLSTLHLTGRILKLYNIAYQSISRSSILMSENEDKLRPTYLIDMTVIDSTCTAIIEIPTTMSSKVMPDRTDLCD